MQKNRYLIAFIIMISMMISTIPVYADENQGLDIKAKSVVLMEASTGKILYEKNAHEKMSPASVTKVMSLLLIMEAISDGKIKLDEKVTVSEYAASMGGSQVYLEPGEQMTVNDMLKAIVVASGNDSTVAMAEHLAGSEQGFVNLMNAKAKSLGMNDTTFYNTTGLDDESPYNLTSAFDIALMSRELLKYPLIHKYSTIWIDSLRNGKFGLANTNKLIRFYPGANGLKTGSTSKALFCLSGSAKRDNLQLVAGIMAGPTSKDRFDDAKKLFNFGFANYKALHIANSGDKIKEIAIDKGLERRINSIAKSDVNIVIKKGEESKITPEILVPDYLPAPINKGQKVGEIVYKIGDKVLGRYDIIAEKDVEKINIFNAFGRLMQAWVNT